MDDDCQSGRCKGFGPVRKCQPKVIAISKYMYFLFTIDLILSDLIRFFAKINRLNLAKGVLRMMIVRAKTVMVIYFGGSRVVNVQRASAMR